MTAPIRVARRRPEEPRGEANIRSLVVGSPPAPAQQPERETPDPPFNHLGPVQVARRDAIRMRAEAMISLAGGHAAGGRSIPAKTVEQVLREATTTPHTYASSPEKNPSPGLRFHRVEEETVTEIVLADSGLTPHEIDGIIAAIAESRSEGTRKAYRSRLEQWRGWCERTGRCLLPADPNHIAAHLEYLAGDGKSVSTINSTLAALRALHEDAGLADPTVATVVRKTRAGLTRRIGEAPVKQAHPLSVPELRRMLTTCDNDGVRGVRDRAILLVGYAGALRRSELAALDVRAVGRKRDGIALTVRRSKGDQTGKGSVVGIVRGEHTETCAVTALYAWLDLTEFTEGPIFRPITRHNSVPLTARGLTGDSIDEIVQRRAALAGLGDLPISGHSLRAGHATTAAEAGVDAARIARTTRHARLETLATYVRPAEALRDSTSRDLGL